MQRRRWSECGDPPPDFAGRRWQRRRDTFLRRKHTLAGTTLAKPSWAAAMTRAPATELIRRAILRHGFEDVSDATLLVRYTRHADSDAFAELVHRYAGLVWGACRRQCADEHLAEDAFQATFV